MDYESYENFLTTRTPNCKNSTDGCPICDETKWKLDQEEEEWLAEHDPTAKCRLPCGHVFHNYCVLRLRRRGDDLCPVCGLDVYPRYPECWLCGNRISPDRPVSHVHRSRRLFHLDCYDEWDKEQRRRHDQSLRWRRNRYLKYKHHGHDTLDEYTDEEDEDDDEDDDDEESLSSSSSEPDNGDEQSTPQIPVDDDELVFVGIVPKESRKPLCTITLD